jgi:hypothetical protein
MSLLQQDSTELDDAAKGEELTKGTSHLVLATISATIVVAVAIAIYVIAEQKPPIATGDVVAVWAHPQHIETSGVDSSGALVPKQIVDEVLVFTHVKLHNQAGYPIVLQKVLTNATLNDGIHSSYAANKADYDRIFIAYPDVPVPHGPALSPLDTTLDPGQTVEGTFVSAFKVSKQQWDARKNLNFTFSFRYQPNLVLTPKVTVIEQ